MPILGLLEIAAQIYCIVHCIQNRRGNWWILIILIPLIGCTVYFLTEILPARRNANRYGQGTANANPLRYRPVAQDLPRLRQQIEFSNTVQNKENLADAYETSLQALHKIRALSDYRASKVRLLLARNYAALEQHDKAREGFLFALEKYTDLEIPYRYAEYLYTQKELPAALNQLEFIEQTVARMPRQAKKQNKNWIQSAKQAQKALQQELA